MKNFIKISFLALCLSTAVNSKAMWAPRDNSTNYVGPVLGGMVAGWAYERFLYRLPLLLGVCGAGITAFAHVSCVQGCNNDQRNVVAGVALVTALGLYMFEKEAKEQKIVIVHQAYPVSHYPQGYPAH